MATIITLVAGWFAYEAVRATCFAGDPSEEGSEPKVSEKWPARPSNDPLPGLAFRAMTAAGKSKSAILDG